MQKLINSYEKGLTYLSIGCTAAITCLTTADAMGRYLINRPILGAYEVTEGYLMATVVFLGLCYAYREGAYIRVSFFVDRLPSQVNIVLNYFVQIFTILLGLILLIGAVWQAYRSIVGGVVLGFLRIPSWPPYVIVCIGLLSMNFVMVLDLWKIRSGRSGLFKGQSSEV
jgi:TRAP-type C4-dicarboxylate transport system permease small subunit